MTLKNYLRLSYELSKIEFKLKNEGTYLGILWYLLNPILLFIFLLIIFSKTLGENIAQYKLYLFLGVIMFNFFQQTTIESTKAISLYKSTIKSVRFSNSTIISALVLKTLYSHIFEIIIFIIFMVIFNASIKGIIFYPLIVFFFSIFILGISLALSSIAIYFTDIENIWTFTSRLFWFATPIFYSIEKQSFLYKLNLFNPINYYIEIARQTIIYSKVPSLIYLALSVFFSLASLFIGLLIFKRLEIKFAEKIR